MDKGGHKVLKIYFTVFLLIYIAIVFYYAVISRDIVFYKRPVRLDLFHGYFKPSTRNYGDLILNLVCFIPVGFLFCLVSGKRKLLNAFLGGLSVSLLIECAQLLFRKGIFDVDDLFNNTIGAFVGALLANLVMRISTRHST